MSLKRQLYDLLAIFWIEMSVFDTGIIKGLCPQILQKNSSVLIGRGGQVNEKCYLC